MEPCPKALPRGRHGGKLNITSPFGAFRLAELLVLIFTLAAATVPRADAAETNGAVVKVSGYGYIGNRRLKQMIQTLRPAAEKATPFDANFIEDAALLITSELQRNGYLKPRLVAQCRLVDGSQREFQWMQTEREPLPRPLLVRELRFRVSKGVLYHYHSVKFKHLEGIASKEATSFFVESGALIPLQRNRIYTPDKLRQSVANLKEVLERRGYSSNSVEVLDVRQNDRKGEVDVQLGVQSGPRFFVRSIREELYLESSNHLERVSSISTNATYSPLWVQAFKQARKSTYFHQGYPDCAVDLVWTNATTESTNRVAVDLLARIYTGPWIVLNKVKFEGYRKTKLSTLQNRVQLEEGARLDRTKVEEGRYRLTRLGIFDSVELRYDVADEHERDAVYTVKEGKRLDLSVLAGWGSYEMLRGGIDLEQFNMFGLAHHSRLRLVQSFKSSSADYNYNVPDFFGNDIDLFLTASALRRQEVSFVREEYGGGLGGRK